MADNKNGAIVDEIDVEEPPLREAEGSFMSGWPAMLISLAMVCAALYSFSPRDPAVFAETKIEPNQLLVTGVARQGSRYLAAGELGIILVADSPSGPWTQATIDNNRGSNLTDVKFIGKDIAIAVGHSGWILRSTDGGQNWVELDFKEDNADPLLGISGPFKGKSKGKIFIYGAFGQYLISTDGGKTFVAKSLNVVEKPVSGGEQGDESAEPAVEDEVVAEAPEAEAAPYDPFADFGTGGGLDEVAGLHFYDIAELGDGSLMLVGERGTVLKSNDAGASWFPPADEIYTGSFYGVMPLGKRGALVYGMRGNAFYTSDLGNSWTQSDVPVVQGLFGGAKSDAGTIVLVGASNTVLVSKDKGKSFIKASSRGPFGVATIVPLDSGSWLTGGEGGLSVKNVLNYISAAATGVWS